MEEQLFIIGNGFDLAHGMPTRYIEFRDYLIDHENDSAIGCLYDLLKYRINGDIEWNKFEEELGFLDFEDELDYYKSEVDNEYDDNYIAVANMNTTIENCSKIIESLNEIFSAWIGTIDMPNEDKIIDGFYDLLQNHENKFLSFNYTNTLEELYSVNKVCHIHGAFRMEDELLVGHGEESQNVEAELECGGQLSEYAGPTHGSSDECLEIRKNIDLIHNLLRKNVSVVLQNNKRFFCTMNNIKRIYSFGFSYGNVDLPYIKNIVKKIDDIEQVEWFLNSYDSEQNNEVENKIRACGFTGTFHRYTCK